jgi:UDP-N-acetylmuramate: L-alanyl-gamma-D-glutamyl-meso-diaminopimelate ligase
MHVHILGICGTFMAGIAVIAKQSGYQVSGADINVYPPMSDQLASQGIRLSQGYSPADIDPAVDCVIVGNVIRRGNPAIEYVLEKNIPYVSGPQWLAEHVLRGRWALAIAGTHGKTTTASLLAWILEFSGHAPGFLIGGVPENFGISARIGQGAYFVIEADEYDSAFFDKRSKFIHYHPKTLILNNLEFDHADIFPDLSAIQQQFHYLVRTVPGNGLIVRNGNDIHLQEMLEKGCWTPVVTFGSQDALWQARLKKADGSHFEVWYEGTMQGEVGWVLTGRHNVENALAAIAAASHAGVSPKQALAALPAFKNVKRRLELKGEKSGICVYDDFAHHPTAIAATLAGLRAKVGKARIVVVLEFGSYTMRSGVHRQAITQSLKEADMVICKRPDGEAWGLGTLLKHFSKPTGLFDTVEALLSSLAGQLKMGDHVVVMSNSGFGGIHEKLLQMI